MESDNTGIVTSGVEVVQITPFGVWLYIEGTEYFLDHDHFPWFRHASVSAIWKVELDARGNLHWQDLDVDLERQSLTDLKSYPLVHHE